MIASEASAAHNASDSYTVSRPRAWFAFAMIFLLMLSDYIDRQMIVSLFPHLKQEWGLSDKQLGGLVSVISVVVAIGCLPVALMADRFGRVKSIFCMASIWSMATIACMFSRSYSQLFAARAVVGLGETGYGSVGAALINALFPKRLHSTLLGAFFAAGSLGAVIGVVLGGFISEHWGWRAAFGVVGFPGLVMAVLILLIPDYKNVVQRLKPRPAQADGVSYIGRLYTALTSGPTLLWVCLAGAFQLIVVSTVWAWMPSFFNRYHGLSPATAAKHAALVVLCSAVGALLWGAVADRVGRQHPQRKLYLMALLTTLTCLVFSCAFSVAHAPGMQYRLILLGSLLMSCTVGVTTSTVLDVTHSSLRSTGSAVLALFQNLFGLAIGPFVGGLMSDAWGLSSALAVIPWVGILSALCFLKASRTYGGDLQRVTDMAQALQVPVVAGMPGAVNPA